MTQTRWRERFHVMRPTIPRGLQDVHVQLHWTFADPLGDERGQWMVASVAGGEQHYTDPTLPPAFQAGLAVGSDFAVVGLATDAAFVVYAVRPGHATRLLYQHRERCEVGHLSRDEQLVSLQHSEQGNWYFPALHVLDLHGVAQAELSDEPDRGLWSGPWSPVHGDQRLIILHERQDRLRPAIWAPLTDALIEFTIDLPGDITADWYPDASALLLTHTFRGRDELYRLDLASNNVTHIATPHGSISAAGVRNDGTVWYRWDRASEPGDVRAGDAVLSQAGDGNLPSSVPYSDLDVEGIHAFLAEPPSPRPHPTLFRVYGDSPFFFRDSWSPLAQTWVDHGFAVVTINARGSGGYGRSWRTATIGNPGLTELADVAAVHDWVCQAGIADPARTILFGESWGGYMTLLGVGVQPERWAAGLAMMPVGDWIACYEDPMEPLRAKRRAQFRGTPTEVPEAYRRASPLTYVEQVRVPLHLVISEHDSRCPLRQNEHFIDRLKELGKPHEVIRQQGGHGAWGGQMMQYIERQLSFVARHLDNKG